MKHFSEALRGSNFNNEYILLKLSERNKIYIHRLLPQFLNVAAFAATATASSKQKNLIIVAKVYCLLTSTALEINAVRVLAETAIVYMIMKLDIQLCSEER